MTAAVSNIRGQFGQFILGWSVPVDSTAGPVILDLLPGMGDMRRAELVDELRAAPHVVDVKEGPCAQRE